MAKNEEKEKEVLVKESADVVALKAQVALLEGQLSERRENSKKMADTKGRNVFDEIIGAPVRPATVTMIRDGQTKRVDF